MKDKWFTLDVPEMEWDFWESEERAKQEAERIIGVYREEAVDGGWPEEEEFVLWGRVMGWNEKCDIERKSDYEEWPYDSDFDEVYNMKLVEEEA